MVPEGPRHHLLAADAAAAGAHVVNVVRVNLYSKEGRIFENAYILTGKE